VGSSNKNSVAADVEEALIVLEDLKRASLRRLLRKFGCLRQVPHEL